jgi:hypothetical protein
MVFTLTASNFEYARAFSEGPHAYSTTLKLTNKTFGLLKHAPSTFLKRLARQLMKVGRETVPVEKISDAPARYGLHIRLTGPCTKTEYLFLPSYLIHATGQDYYRNTAHIVRFLFQVLVRIYSPYYRHTRTEAPYTYRNKGDQVYMNYGGKGQIRITPKEQLIRYTYTHLSAYKPHALVYRLMNQYPHWTHEINVQGVTHPQVFHHHLENLKVASHLTGGDVWIRKFLPQTPPDELPF